MSNLENECEEICLGHLTYLKKECEKCIEDEFNKYCNKYKSIKTFYVEDERKYTD